MKDSFFNNAVIALVCAIGFFLTVLVVDLVFGKLDTLTMSERIVHAVLFGIFMSIFNLVERKFFKK